MNPIEAMQDKNVFRPFIEDSDGLILSWRWWIVALKVIFGLAITNLNDLQLAKKCTGRKKFRSQGYQTTLLLTGRRSGKSRIAAIIGAFEAVLAGHERKLSKGERGVVVIASPTRGQSRIVRDYLRAIFDVPMLRREIVAETKEGFELRSGIRIQILAGDFKTVRGFTVVAAIVDEICFFGYGDDAKVKSDTELIRAIQPALATTNGRLICISSPYAMKGWAYEKFKKHFGNDKGQILVWNCSSRTMNPTLPQEVIDEAMAEDPAAARAEYEGQFRDDVALFLPREVVEAAVMKGRQELSPQTGIRYSAFVDISGGRVDDAAMAIAHMSGRKVIIDCIRRYKPPFSPDHVIGQMCKELVRYRIERVGGDNYSAEFTKNAFERRGFRYGNRTPNVFAKSPMAKVAKPKSQLYLEFLPRLCSGEIELLDNEILINQLASLERKTRSGGRDIVDHAPNSHDDVSNVVAGVCDVVIRKPIVLGGQEVKQESNEGEQTSIMGNFNARRQAYYREMAMLSLPDPDPSGLMTALESGQLKTFTHGF